MNLTFGYHITITLRKILETELDKLNVTYKFNGIGDVEITETLGQERLELLKSNLNDYGIYIQENQKDQLVQRIRDVVVEMVNSDMQDQNFKTSNYIANKLNFSYGYLSNLFSEATSTTLEYYIILQKIERAKVLILNGEHTLTEIAYMLNYSSVGHLSNQFKKITGLTSSAFNRIVTKRKLLQKETPANNRYQQVEE